MVTSSEPECRVSLAQLRVGERASVRGYAESGDDARTLRAMGLRPDACVTLCQGGRTCIVEVTGTCGPSCRIGLDRRLAESVLVGPEQA